MRPVRCAGERARPGFRCSCCRPRLSEDQTAVVLHRRDHHPASVLGLRRRAAQVLSVQGDRRMRGALLGGPLADGIVQGLGRQGCEDFVEGGDRRRGIALPGRAPERPTASSWPWPGRRTGRTRSRRDSRQAGPRRRACSRGSAPARSGTRVPRPGTVRIGAAIGSVCCSAQCADLGRLSASAAPSLSSNTKTSLGWPWWRQRGAAPGSRAKPRVIPSERQFDAR